jgi:hypothetical protein
MIDIVILYILGALITCSLLILRFNTSIVIHILELFCILDKDAYHVMSDLDEALENKYLARRWPMCLIPELWTCCLCLSFWTGGLVSLIIALAAGLSLWFIPACMFSWIFFVWILQRKGAFGE